jgi:cobalt-precorrin 5A hydrolase
MVNMALLTGSSLQVHDPFNLLGDVVAADVPGNTGRLADWQPPAVYVDDRRSNLPDHVLVLRPPTLVAGIGCNRHTTKEEIAALLQQVMDRNGLAAGSLCALSTIDLKADEPGLLTFSADLIEILYRE